MSALLGQKVEITTPTISVVDKRRLEEEFIHPYVAVKVEYTAGLSGMNLFVIKQSDAAIIADLMLGGDGTEPEYELRRNPFKCSARSDESDDGLCGDIDVDYVQ